MEEILVLPYSPSWAQKEARDNVNQQALSRTLGALLSSCCSLLSTCVLVDCMCI